MKIYSTNPKERKQEIELQLKIMGTVEKDTYYGGHKWRLVVTEYSVQVYSDKGRFTPEIHFCREQALGKPFSGKWELRIQTSSWGDLTPQEIGDMLDGYKAAQQAAAEMTQFLKDMAAEQAVQEMDAVLKKIDGGE